MTRFVESIITLPDKPPFWMEYKMSAQGVRYIGKSEARRLIRTRFGNEAHFGNSPYRSAVGAIVKLVVKYPHMNTFDLLRLIEWKVLDRLEIMNKRSGIYGDHSNYADTGAEK